MDEILYGAAYYDEYMPTDRIDTDVAMMQAAGITVVRIAESTWSTLEPQPGVFDFTHVDRALDAIEAAGIHVIVGTPTYAVPAWLVQSHPEVLAVTSTRRGPLRRPPDHEHHQPDLPLPRRAGHPRAHGAHRAPPWRHRLPARQRDQVLRRRLRATCSAGSSSTCAQSSTTTSARSTSLRPRLLVQPHRRLGGLPRRPRHDQRVARRGVRQVPPLAWSRSSSAGRPGSSASTRATTSSSRRTSTSTGRPGWSYGLQPVRRPLQGRGDAWTSPASTSTTRRSPRLTGKEIAFGGDMTRSIKGGANYLVLETQAQGQLGWLPYPGQLRLQAYSHLASGADGRHVLALALHPQLLRDVLEAACSATTSRPTPPTRRPASSVREAAAAGGVAAAPAQVQPGRDHGQQRGAHGAAVVHRRDRVHRRGLRQPSIGYNDVLRWVYDALFELNVEVDFVSADDRGPRPVRDGRRPGALLGAGVDAQRLREYVEAGGHLVTTFKPFVADEHVTVWHDRAPHGLTGRLGLTYNQFTRPGRRAASPCTATWRPPPAPPRWAPTTAPRSASWSCLQPDGAEVLASYDHPAWGGHAAVTRHRSGAGYGDPPRDDDRSRPRPRRARPRRARRRACGTGRRSSPGPSPFAAA